MGNYSDARSELVKLLVGLPGAVDQIAILEDPTHHNRETVETALSTVLAALQSGGRQLAPAFWDNPAGQLIAAAQWHLYGDEAIMPLEAARLRYAGDIAAGNLTENAARSRLNRDIAAGKIPLYRRPATEIIHRKKRQRSRRDWYLRRSEL